MNLNEVRAAIRQVIAEKMKKGGLPKSGGKLVHLKKELAGLKKMKKSLGQYQIAESGDQSLFVAEYDHMQKFVNELEKIKKAHSKLAEMLDTQIFEVEDKVASETEKIKEMMGLIENAKKEPKVKADKKTNKKEVKKEAKKEVSKKDKIMVIKEWIWYTCDEGTAKEDINKYNKMVDTYFANKNDVTKEDFKKIWATVIEKYGVGDVGADWEAFSETWKDVQTGTLVNEGEDMVKKGQQKRR